MTSAKDFRNESDVELKAKLFQFRKDIYDMTSERLEGKMPKTHQVGQKRKEIARIMTVLREREIKEGKEAGHGK